MMSLAQRFTARVLLKWAAMRSRMGHPAARQRKTTGGLMTKEQLLRATEMLVLDADAGPTGGQNSVTGAGSHGGFSTT